jgi:hypothetical protein
MKPGYQFDFEHDFFHLMPSMDNTFSLIYWVQNPRRKAPVVKTTSQDKI